MQARVLPPEDLVHEKTEEIRRGQANRIHFLCSNPKCTQPIRADKWEVFVFDVFLACCFGGDDIPSLPSESRKTAIRRISLNERLICICKRIQKTCSTDFLARGLRGVQNTRPAGDRTLCEPPRCWRGLRILLHSRIGTRWRPVTIVPCSSWNSVIT